MFILETRMTWLRFLFQYGMGDGLRNRKKIRLLAICIAMSVVSAEELSRGKSLTAPIAGLGWTEVLADGC